MGADVGTQLEKGAEAVSTPPEGSCGTGLRHSLLFPPFGDKLMRGCCGWGRSPSPGHAAGPNWLEARVRLTAKYTEPPRAVGAVGAGPYLAHLRVPGQQGWGRSNGPKESSTGMSQVFQQTTGPLEPPEVQASPERVPDFLEHQTLSITPFRNPGLCEMWFYRTLIWPQRYPGGLAPLQVECSLRQRGVWPCSSPGHRALKTGHLLGPGRCMTHKWQAAGSCWGPGWRWEGPLPWARLKAAA